MPLRELIAERFTVRASQVVLTNGALQGFVLLAQHFGGANPVCVESPTYDRPLKIMLQNGIDVISVGMDEQGLIPDELENSLQGKTPAFLYTIPTFQNPSGRTIPEARRRQIVDITLAHGVTILEDDPYGLIRFEGQAPTSLFELARETTIYTSSFSKTIAPGLRVGWYILPDALARDLTERANSTYITPVLLGQAIVYEFMTRGSFEPNLKRVNALLGMRRDAMLASLEKHLSGARWSRPEGGYFIWLELPAGTEAKHVLERAEGVTAVIGTDFGGDDNTIRLAYSYVSPEEIDLGIQRLAAAI
jgi:DNA-binding transcriptional MocR family regulator